MAIRLPVAVQFALLVTLSIFWVLWRLTGAPILERAITIAPPAPEPVIEQVQPPQQRVWIKPIPPQRLPPIVRPGYENPIRVRIEPGPTTAPPGPVTIGGGELITEMPGAPSDREPTPLVRIQPDYPVPAERRGIEGWVVVEFTITRAGAVRDARIVESKPARIFDANTLRAVARWRYNPRVIDGEAAEAVGVQSRIVFSLDAQ